MEPNEIFRMLHKITCEVMRVDYVMSLTSTRDRKIIEARHVTMYILCRKLAINMNFSYKSIGEFFINSELRKGFDHVTVMHAEKTIQNMIDTNSESRQNINFASAINQIIYRFKAMTAQLDNLPFDLMTPKKAVLWALLGI